MPKPDRLENDHGVKCELCNRAEAESYYRKKKLCIDCYIFQKDMEEGAYDER